MTIDRIDFQREFQIWIYSVDHSQLLLRSNRSNEYVTRVDVLFKDVAGMEMPAFFDGLVIMEASKDQALELNPQLGSQTILGRKVFTVRGLNFSGYVVAAAVFWHEDEGYHYDKSHFSKSFMSLEV